MNFKKRKTKQTLDVIWTLVSMDVGFNGRWFQWTLGSMDALDAFTGCNRIMTDPFRMYLFYTSSIRNRFYGIISLAFYLFLGWGGGGGGGEGQFFAGRYRGSVLGFSFSEAEEKIAGSRMQIAFEGLEMFWIIPVSGRLINQFCHQGASIDVNFLPPALPRYRRSLFRYKN